MSTMSTLPSRQRTIRGILAWLIRANTTRNLAVWDRGIRVLLPLVIGALWVAGAVSTAVAIPLGVLALMLLPTAFTGACSIYYALGVSTLPKRKR
jgi:hypothetical protein